MPSSAMQLNIFGSNSPAEMSLTIEAPLLTAFFATSLLKAVSYTHLRAHETPEHLVCRLLLEKKKIHEAISTFFELVSKFFY